MKKHTMPLTYMLVTGEKKELFVIYTLYGMLLFKSRYAK